MDWFVQQIAENMDSSNSKLMPLSSFKKQTERTSVSQETEAHVCKSLSYRKHTKKLLKRSSINDITEISLKLPFSHSKIKWNMISLYPSS